MSNSEQRQATVAVIGAGEMGTAVGVRMRALGARVLTTLTGRSAASAARVRHAGLEVIDDDERLVAEASILLSIVPPGEAMAVAGRFRPALGAAAAKPVFADCNAIAPATVSRLAALLADTHAPFIDAGIIGGPPPAGRPDRGPRIYASGPHAQRLEALRAYGLNIMLLDGPIGDASGLKMAYAGLTKGLTALGMATIGRATRAGLGTALVAELRSSRPEILAQLASLVPSSYPKAYRFVAEMEQIAEFLGEAGAGTDLYAGAARLYQEIAREWARNPDSAEPVKAFLRAAK